MMKKQIKLFPKSYQIFHKYNKKGKNSSTLRDNEPKNIKNGDLKIPIPKEIEWFLVAMLL